MAQPTDNPEAARASIDEAHYPTPPPRRRPRPLLAPRYVWCDGHGEIHPAIKDYYDEGIEHHCDRSNWRRVYISSTEDREEF
jgi:hypothetical protein